MRLYILMLLIFAADTFAAASETLYNIDQDTAFINISKINKQIIVNLKYSGDDNIFNEDVYGDFHSCYLGKDAALKLDKAQMMLDEKKPGYRIVVYDGLRPRDVQYKMWYLVKGTDKENYVSDPGMGSFHNFGAAVDCTIMDEKGNILDMGAPFDH
ncbi:M15 family metallopeptidase, partial [Elusimicrobiota bacterium]